MCFAPSNLGAGGPNENTTGIQHEEVFTPFGLQAHEEDDEAPSTIPLFIYCLTIGVRDMWTEYWHKIKKAPSKAAAILSTGDQDFQSKQHITAAPQGNWPAVDFEITLHHDTHFSEVRRVRKVSDDAFRNAFSEVRRCICAKTCPPFAPTFSGFVR